VLLQKLARSVAFVCWLARNPRHVVDDPVVGEVYVRLFARALAPAVTSTVLLTSPGCPL
jgi:hypothetical protein